MRTYMQTSPRPHRAAGFTLIEVLLAIGITATVMLTVGTTFQVMLSARDVVNDLSESSEEGPRILKLIERDLRGLWTYNVRNNAVLLGEQSDLGGKEADRIHFLTTTDSVGAVRDLNDAAHRTTICEVGYLLKPNSDPESGADFELWRREDPMVDDDLRTQGDQGTFQLVSDRLQSFDITYYQTLGNTAEPLFEWDTTEEDRLPKRIKVEFTIERKRSNKNVVSDAEIEDFDGNTKTYVRHFVLPNRLEDILQAQNARVPVLPPPPPEEAAGGPGEGPEGPAGPAGPGGRGDLANGLAKGPEGGRGKGSGGDGKGSGRNGPGGKPSTSGFGGRPGAIPGGGGQVPTQLPPGFNFQQFFGSGSGGSLFGGGK